MGGSQRHGAAQSAASVEATRLRNGQVQSRLHLNLTGLARSARSGLARSGASLGADDFIEPLVDPHLGGHVDPFVHARPGP